MTRRETSDHYTPLGMYLLACMCAGIVLPRDVLGLEHWGWSVLGMAAGFAFCTLTAMAWIAASALAPLYWKARRERRSAK